MLSPFFKNRYTVCFLNVTAKIIVMHFDCYPSNIQLQLFNTQTRQKEPVHPLKEGTIRLYTCGPTVYAFAHIGNFRTFCIEDILRRSLKYFGMKVKQAMNLTDVDDKTIRGAIAKKVSLDEFTRPYKEAFFEDLQSLNIEKVEFYPAATDFIPHMINMIQSLVDKEIAYRGKDGSIYFAIKRFPNYGCLSHLDLDDLQAGASERVAQDEYTKENVSDFVLWKAYDAERDGPVFWDSPFGKGRPGWHLECSVMAHELLGETIDIHAGGVDLIFPHHENEIAQSEAFTCKPFVKHWLHVEHLLVDHKKMSKSLGNFYTLKDVLQKGYEGVHLRFMFLQTHYRVQLNFTLSGLDAAKASLERINDFVFRLQSVSHQSEQQLSDPVKKAVNEALTIFSESLADDLNTAHALSALFDLIRQVNGLCDNQAVSRTDADYVLAALHKMNQVLGIISFERQDAEIPQEIQQLLDERNQARIAKNWKESDRLRDLILEKGYIIEDSPTGARLKKK